MLLPIRLIQMLIYKEKHDVLSQLFEVSISTIRVYIDNTKFQHSIRTFLLTVLTSCIMFLSMHILICTQQGWGQVQYLYLSTYLSVLDVLEYLVYGNVKVLVLVLDQKLLGC